jgi:hypothetical protein
MTVLLKLKTINGALADVVGAVTVSAGTLDFYETYRYPGVCYGAANIWVTTRRKTTANTRHVILRYNNTTLANELTETSLATQITGLGRTCIAERSNAAILVWETGKWMSVSLTGTPGTVYQVGYPELYPATKPFYTPTANQSLAVWMVNRTPTYRNYYLIELIDHSNGSNTGRVLMGPVARSAGAYYDFGVTDVSNQADVALDANSAVRESYAALTMAHDGDMDLYNINQAPKVRLGIDRLTTFDRITQRQSAKLGPALYVSGGEMRLWDGTQTSEPALQFAPRVIGASHDGTHDPGALSFGAYSYRSIAEWFDEHGQRHRSAPSGPRSVIIKPAGTWDAVTTFNPAVWVNYLGAAWLSVALPAWSGTPTYVIGDCVNRSSVDYRCILGHTNQQPPNATYWVVITNLNHKPGDVSDAAALAYWSSATPFEGTVNVVELTWAPLTRRDDVAIHLYRTLVNGTIYYRATPLADPPINGVTATYTDSEPDSSIASNEVLYTNTGILPFVPGPPCNYLITAMNRLVAAGLESPGQVMFSHEYVAGEPAEWSDLPSFIVTVPEPVTGLAVQDDAVYIFSRRGIWLVYGPGPDAQGNGTFTLPRQLPANVGCVDYRSIVTSDLGLMFLGEPGKWYLVPRGGGAPVFIGQPVRDTMALYPTVLSHALDPVNQTTAILVRDSGTGTTTLQYSWRTGQWTLDPTPGSQVLTCIGFGPPHGDDVNQTLLRSGTDIMNYQGSAYDEQGSGWLETRVQTGAIRPFGRTGYGHVYKVRCMGETVGACAFTLGYSLDGTSWTDRTWQLTAAGLLDLEVPVQRPLSTEFFVRCYDAVGTGSAKTAGVRPKAFSIEVVPRGGGPRLGADRRG